MLGLNPVYWYRSSTTTGPGGSVVSALASQANGRGGSISLSYLYNLLHVQPSK